MPDVDIKIMKSGPYLVTGPVTLQDPAGGEYTLEKDTIALCRCGQSANKPFCDGAHAREGFTAEETAA